MDRDTDVRWVAVPDFEPASVVVGTLVFVRDHGDEQANRVAARNAYAAAQILKQSK